MRVATTLTVLALLAVGAPASSANNATYDVDSTDFKAGEPLPKSASCEGDGKSPTLHWTTTTSGASPKSFALIVDDPDAPGGTFTHWVLFNIPGATAVIPQGAKDVGVAGQNDFKKNEYGAACPPKGAGTHHYHFKVFALDTDKLPVGAGSPRNKVEDAMRGHVVGQGEIVGTYGRK